MCLSNTIFEGMNRIQKKQLLEQLNTSRILVVSGPRLAGKEELLADVLQDIPVRQHQLNLASKVERKRLEDLAPSEWVKAFDGFDLVVIHEAQYLKNLQLIIELVLQEELQCSILLNCSFEPMIDDLLREVLEAQGLHIRIYPPSFYELASHFGLPEEEKLLEQRLIYGNYPAVVSNLDTAKEVLDHLLDTILVTDLGVTDRINKKQQLKRLLQQLAFLIGEPISYNDLATKCELDNETVERYIDLLVKAFVLVRIDSYSTSKRYELKKSHLVYFVDTGMRNMLIQNFNPSDLRMDIQQLWKNWLTVERIKWMNINQKMVAFMFWRTHTKQQIDLIEQSEKGALAYKIAWDKKRKLKFPAMFGEYYPGVPQLTLNKSTYWGFLSKK